jgi:hypothetical protein
MPQLSLYIDADTLSKLEVAAKINNTSVSKWAIERLKEDLSHTWPNNFKSLFGSIDDANFNVNQIVDVPFSIDVERETL